MPKQNFQLEKELVYKEQRAHHGRVHQTMYAMPPSFAVVLGALWYFAAEQLDKAPLISMIIFIFATLTAGYFRKAFKSFAMRAAELRQHLQVFEGEYAFYNDKKSELAAAKEIYERYEALVPDRLTKEIAQAGSLPSINQGKTRDPFIKLMMSAEILSGVGCALALYKCALAIDVDLSVHIGKII